MTSQDKVRCFFEEGVFDENGEIFFQSKIIELKKYIVFSGLVIQLHVTIFQVSHSVPKSQNVPNFKNFNFLS